MEILHGGKEGLSEYQLSHDDHTNQMANTMTEVTEEKREKEDEYRDIRI